MAIQEADGIVNSYLQGIQIALQRKQQESEQQYRAAETERANTQVDLLKKNYDSQQKQIELAHKASLATFQLQAHLHGDELAKSLQNEDTSGDPNAPGRYTIQGPDGQPYHFTARTLQQQLNAENLLKKQDAEVVRETERLKQEQDRKNRLEEIGLTGTNQKELENLRAASAERVAKIQQQAANFREGANRASAERVALANLTGDPSSLTGTNANINADYTKRIETLTQQVLDGNLSREGLAKEGKGVMNAVNNAVTKSGGIVLPNKQIEWLNHINGLAGFVPKMDEAINSQGDKSIGGYSIGGHMAPGLTNPISKKNFDILEGDTANIAKGIGGEQGQRLTNFTIGLSNNAYIPSIGASKELNIKTRNNFTKKLGETLDTEVLGNVPAGQRAHIIDLLGIHNKLAPYLPAQVQNQQPATVDHSKY